MSDQQKKISCEVYSRIVGYLRPVGDWNPSKQLEFGERKTYDAAIQGGESNGQGALSS